MACQPGYQAQQGVCLLDQTQREIVSLAADIKAQSGEANANGQVRFTDDALGLDLQRTITGAEKPLDSSLAPGADCGMRGATGCDSEGMISNAHAEVVYDGSSFLASVSDDDYRWTTP